jgi:hypothetical protein
MQTITLSESALAVLRFRAKKYPVKVNDRTLPAYRELVAAGIMVPDQESGFQFTEDGWARREEWISAAEAHIRSLEPRLPERIDLSEAARKALERHLAGDKEVTDANREAYRELARAGIMIPLHSFIGGWEAAFKFTWQGWERRFEWIENDCAKESA